MSKKDKNRCLDCTSDSFETDNYRSDCNYIRQLQKEYSKTTDTDIFNSLVNEYFNEIYSLIYTVLNEHSELYHKIRNIEQYNTELFDFIDMHSIEYVYSQLDNSFYYEYDTDGCDILKDIPTDFKEGFKQTITEMREVQ